MNKVVYKIYLNNVVLSAHCAFVRAESEVEAKKVLEGFLLLNEGALSDAPCEEVSVLGASEVIGVFSD